MRVAGVMVLCGLMVVCGVCAHADDLRVAVLDMSRLVNVHPKTAENRALFEEQFAAFNTEHKAMIKEFEAEKVVYDELLSSAANKAFSAEARAEKKKEVEAKRDSLREYALKIRRSETVRPKQLQDERRRMRRHVVGKVRGIVAEYAAGKGYTLVLDSSSDATGGEPVVYSSVKTDITDDIVKLIKGSEAAE